MHVHRLRSWPRTLLLLWLLLPLALPAKAILRLGNGAEPKSLDPQIVTGLTEYNILQALYEGLVTLNGQTLEPEPGVAESWSVSEDGLTYTFHFDPEARWSNGDPIRPSDFVYSYERILNPTLAAEYAFILYFIENAEAYNQGNLKDFSQVGVRAVDERTLEIRLKNPTPFFLSLLVHFAWYPVHPPTIEAFDARRSEVTRWSRPGSMVSNGPFMLDGWRLGYSITAVPNPYYHGADQIAIDEIRWFGISKQEVEERIFRAGKIDITDNVPMTKIERMLAEKKPELRLVPDLGTYFYIFNVEKPPLDDVRVRKALSLAVNRREVASIRKRDEQPAFHVTPPGTAGYTIEPLFEENVEQARKLLAEAGYPDGAGFPELTLLYNTSDMHKQAAEAIQARWKKELGIEVVLKNQAWKIYLETRNTRQFDICRAGWFADYNDPMTFLDYWMSNSGVNHSNWGSKRFDELIAKANATVDAERRQAILREAESLLIDECPLIPLFFYRRAYLESERVEGWPINIMNIRDYRAVRLR